MTSPFAFESVADFGVFLGDREIDRMALEWTKQGVNDDSASLWKAILPGSVQ